MTRPYSNDLRERVVGDCDLTVPVRFNANLMPRDLTVLDVDIVAKDGDSNPLTRGWAGH